MAQPWQYDEPSRRYRDAASGRFVSAAGERAIRDDYIGRKQAAITEAAGKVASGELGVAEWERTMQRTLREMHGTQLAFGRGGRQQVTATEWQRLGGVVSEQERYLADFAAAIARGDLTPAQIAARAAMYGDAARSSYHRGKAAAYDGLALPGYPGDGGDGAVCLSRCLCSWEITETDAEWLAYWRLDGGEHCQGCVWRSEQWSPFIQMKSEMVAA
jgi:hypothetical protein